MGAGGFAREVVWLVADMNRTKPQYEVLGFVVSDLAKVGERDSREKILGDFNWIAANRDRVNALTLAMGTPSVRLKLAAELQARFPEIEWPVLVHPSAHLGISAAGIQRGVQICAGTIVTANVTIGAFSKVDVACTLSHESRLGRGCVVNPGAHVAGGVTVGDGVLIGLGANILQYRSIGNGATVGAGAVVTRDVPAGETVIGIPARPMRKGQ